MKKTWIIVGVIYMLFTCYFFVKIYMGVFIPASHVNNENVRDAVKQVLLDDFKVSAFGGYVDYENIKQTSKKLSIEERKEFFKAIRLYSDELETSSEFQTMLDLIENDGNF
ncbi:hypothetical protein HMY34_02790 [Thiothrix subterranea]|uniref:hypothetical protein n=1 Tax=Thiothrix subterranea TaxID=2735563 RepID=UPI00192C897E|nr:hypothetical protein [Thiothrix subterranea]QQZ27765.1 hypothetical protein HMY34_02790 [Thiothrix subterranea]